MFTVGQYRHQQSLRRARRVVDINDAIVQTVVYLSCGAMAGFLLGVIIEIFGG